MDVGRRKQGGSWPCLQGSVERNLLRNAPARVKAQGAAGLRISMVAGRSGEEFVQQLVKRIFSGPPGRRGSVEIDR
jgi:hypothetical protein